MRPVKNDYAPFYENYISKVDLQDPVQAMLVYKKETLQFFNELNDDSAGKPYGIDKWSYKETLGHIIDTERIMAFRALSIARSEIKKLPGFDQNSYVSMGYFNNRKIADLLMEYTVVRESSVLLFRSFGEAELIKRGIANENEVTVLALGYIIAGHDKHHLNVLKSYYHRNL